MLLVHRLLQSSAVLAVPLVLWFLVRSVRARKNFASMLWGALTIFCASYVPLIAITGLEEYIVESAELQLPFGETLTGRQDVFIYLARLLFSSALVGGVGGGLISFFFGPSRSEPEQVTEGKNEDSSGAES